MDKEKNKLSGKGKAALMMGMALAAAHKFDDTALTKYSTEKLEKEIEERRLDSKHYYRCFKFTFTESIEFELMDRRGERP